MFILYIVADTLIFEEKRKYLEYCKKPNNMKIKVRNMPAFSFDTIQTAADVLTVANRLSRFTQEITAHNLKGGLDKFKSEHKSEQEKASKERK